MKTFIKQLSSILFIFLCFIFSQQVNAQWTRTGTDVHLTNSGDNVGIGTATPNSILDIGGLSVPRTPTVSSTGNQLRIAAGGTQGTGNGAQLHLGSYGARAGVIFQAHQSTSGSEDIDLIVNLNREGQANAPEAMRVKGINGNVGIGTASPDSKLHIEGSRTTEWIRIKSTASGSGGWLDAYSSGTSGFIPGTVGLNTQSGTPLVFATEGTEKMRILGGGNIGIGITNPASTLEVTGEIRTSSSTLTSRATFGMTQSTSEAALFTTYGSGGSFTPMSFYTSDTRRMTISTGGNISIGTNSNSAKLYLYTPASSGAVRGLLVDASVSGGAVPFDVGYDNSGTHVSMMMVNSDGKVGIGTTTPPSDAKLAVEGNIYARKVKVTQATWPDHVFNHDYRLRSLEETEQYIKKNKHLPEIPTATEVEKDGQDLGEMNKLLLQKVEELTLYVIEQNKRIVALEAQQK